MVQKKVLESIKTVRTDWSIITSFRIIMHWPIKKRDFECTCDSKNRDIDSTVLVRLGKLGLLYCGWHRWIESFAQTPTRERQTNALSQQMAFYLTPLLYRLFFLNIIHYAWWNSYWKMHLFYLAAFSRDHKKQSVSIFICIFLTPEKGRR